MRYRMLEAKALNKLFKPMPSNSLFQEVVVYYDRRGTPNEKVEALYLLKCISFQNLHICICFLNFAAEPNIHL